MSKFFTKIVKSIFYLILYPYFLPQLFFVPYYNWKYAKNNGFCNWLLLGEFVASGKALIWPYFVFFETTESDLNHFSKSIDYINQSIKISNNFKAFSTIDSEDLEKIIELKKLALLEAEKVNTEYLNSLYTYWGDHFKNEYIIGLKLIILGYENNAQESLFKGQTLLNKWGDWYSLNVEYIRNNKKNSETNYSPSKNVNDEYPKLNSSELDRYSKILKKSQEVKLTNSDLEIISGIFRDYTKRTGRYMTKNEYDLFFGLVKLSYDYQYELGQSLLLSWDNHKYFTTNGFDELYEKMKLLGSRKPEKLEYDLLAIKAASKNKMIIEDEFGEKYEFGREIILKGIRENELAYENYNNISKVIEKFVR